MKGAENSPLCFQLSQLDGSLPNAATAYRRWNWPMLILLDWRLAQFPALAVEGQHAMHHIPQRNSMSLWRFAGAVR